MSSRIPAAAEAAWPPAIEASGSVGPRHLVDEVEAARETLLDAARREGALLFRGFEVESAQDFHAVVEAFALEAFSYADSLSNAVRVELTPRVFTANEAPAEAIIHLHHELAQTPSAPTHLFFFCARAPETGGATMLCRSDRLFEALATARPAFARACEEKGVIYTVRMPPDDDADSGQGRSWRSTFGVGDRAEAERALVRLGYRGVWEEGDWLRASSPPLPAVVVLADGRKSFFNQLIAATTGWSRAGGDGRPPVTYGDGSPIDSADVQASIEIAEALTVDLAWRPGDVALVDNRLVMHGRRHFTGARRVYAAFGVEPRSGGATR